MYYDIVLLVLFAFIVMLVSFHKGYSKTNVFIGDILYYPILLSSIAWLLLAAEYITVIFQVYNNSTRLVL